MDFFFVDPNIERLPPTQTRLLDLRAESDPDGKRIRVAMELTPFQQRPYIELTLTDSAGHEASSASIVEPVGWKLELTLHIRKPVAPLPTYEARGKIEESGMHTIEYTLTASLSYPDLGEMDRRRIPVICKQQ